MEFLPIDFLDLVESGEAEAVRPTNDASFGNLVAETGANAGWGDYKVVSKFTLAASAIIDKLTARVENTATDSPACALRGLIFTSVNNAPAALLSTGVEVAIAHNQAVSWVDLPLASPVNLSAGDYWLGWHSNAQATSLDIKCAANGGECDFNSDAYADGPTNQFGIPEWTGLIRIAIYASGQTPVSSGFTEYGSGRDFSSDASLAVGGYVTITSAGVVAAGTNVAYARNSSGTYYGPVVVTPAAKSAGWQTVAATLWPDPVALFRTCDVGDLVVPLGGDSVAYRKVT